MTKTTKAQMLDIFVRRIADNMWLAEFHKKKGNDDLYKRIHGEWTGQLAIAKELGFDDEKLRQAIVKTWMDRGGLK